MSLMSLLLSSSMSMWCRWVGVGVDVYEEIDRRRGLLMAALVARKTNKGSRDLSFIFVAF